MTVNDILGKLTGLRNEQDQILYDLKQKMRDLQVRLEEVRLISRAISPPAPSCGLKLRSFSVRSYKIKGE